MFGFAPAFDVGGDYVGRDDPVKPTARLWVQPATEPDRQFTRRRRNVLPVNTNRRRTVKTEAGRIVQIVDIDARYGGLAPVLGECRTEDLLGAVDVRAVGRCEQLYAHQRDLVRAITCRRGTPPARRVDQGNHCRPPRLRSRTGYRPIRPATRRSRAALHHPRSRSSPETPSRKCRTARRP